MKETKKCSLSGLSFTMDDDAYVALVEYLESLKRAYADNPDGTEIIADIEARIAELILSTQDNGRVVERPLVMNIIAQLGTAEDIRDESAVEEDSTRTPQGEPRIPRRLYRDMENARLGGVCAGLSKYFNIEIAWTRIAVFAPLLLILFGGIMPFSEWIVRFGWNLFGVAILSYLIMWIAVPAARTARQKLEANGEKITVQSIRDASAEGRNNSDADSVAKPVIAETVSFFGRLLLLLLKLFAVLLVFVLVFTALGLFIALCVLLLAGIPEPFCYIPGAAGDVLVDDTGKLIAVLGVSVVLVPVVILLYVLLSLLFGAKLNRWVLGGSFLLWIVLLAALPVTAVRYTRHGIGRGYYHNSSYEQTYRLLRDSIDKAAEEYAVEPADTIVIEYSASEDIPSIDLD